MNQRLINWQRDLDSTAIEEYNSLRRALQRNRGFGLFFVQCSPAVGTNIVEEIKKDIKQKKVATLKLDRSIDSLYNEITAIPDIENIDILFISGLEHSLLAYEEYTFGNSEGKTYADSKERYFRSKRGIPRFLGYLNLQRDRFKRDFPLSLVFLVPIFGIQYLIERTPDFFDWRSGLFRFITQKYRVINIDFEYSIQKDKNQLRSELLDTKTLAKELELNSEESLQTLQKQALLEFKCDRYQEVVASYDKYLAINPDEYLVWLHRGVALDRLERYEEAVASYEKGLAINPDEYFAWLFRGVTLERLERYEEAVASYDKCLAINPDADSAWLHRGVALERLERYEEAVASYDKCLAINPDNDTAWFYRGVVLSILERYEEVVASYDKGLAINPDNETAWFLRGVILDRLERYEEAVASYDKCLAINHDDDTAWFNRARCLALLNQIELAIESLTEAIAINREWQESAKTDSDFDNIRDDRRFQSLVNSPLELSK